MGLHLENEVAVVKNPTIISNNPVLSVLQSDQVWALTQNAGLRYTSFMAYTPHNFLIK